ncbi:ecdysone-induced protein 78C-like isoform X1, partial [Vespula maculifrons]
MDVFKIDQSLSAGLGSAPAPDTLTPEVSFDAGSEFNLSFFDGPEENSTQGFSDPGSVGSASASPPPGTPGTIAANPPNAALPIVQIESSRYHSGEVVSFVQLGRVDESAESVSGHDFIGDTNRKSKNLVPGVELSYSMCDEYRDSSRKENFTIRGKTRAFDKAFEKALVKIHSFSRERPFRLLHRDGKTSSLVKKVSKDEPGWVSRSRKFEIIKIMLYIIPLARLSAIKIIDARNADSKERGVTSSLEREVGDDSLQRLASSSCHVKRLPGTKATRKFVPLVQCHGHATCVASTPTKGMDPGSFPPEVGCCIVHRFGRLEASALFKVINRRMFDAIRY